MAKKSALKFVFLEIAIALMGKCDSLPLDGKAVVFGKLTLNKAN